MQSERALQAGCLLRSRGWHQPDIRSGGQGSDPRNLRGDQCDGLRLWGNRQRQDLHDAGDSYSLDWNVFDEMPLLAKTCHWNLADWLPHRAQRIFRGSSLWQLRPSWRFALGHGAPWRFRTMRCTWSGAMTCWSPKRRRSWHWMTKTATCSWRA